MNLPYPTQSFPPICQTLTLKAYKQMKKVWLLSLVICWGIWIPLQAQSTFQTTFGTTEVGDNIPYAITPTSDGGFATTGFSSAGNNIFQSILLTKTNEMGAVQWAKIFGGNNFEVGNDILQTADNGFIVAGRSMSFGNDSEDAFLLKTDAMGNLQWVRAFGGEDADAANSVFQANNDDFIFIGETQSFSPNNERNDVFMVSTDSNGVVNWSKTHSLDFNVDRISGVALPNGGFAFTGLAEYLLPVKQQEESNTTDDKMPLENSLSPQKPWLKMLGDGGGGTATQTGILFVETDATGEIVQQKMFGIPGTIDCFGTSIVPTDDDGYFIGGYTIEPTPFGFNYHISGLKINGSGTIQWSRNFQTFDSFFPVIGNQLNNGNLTLTATNSLTAGIDSRINNYFLNEEGSLIETHQYGASGFNASRDALPNNSGILTAGQSNSFGGSPNFNPLDTYLIQSDGFGNSGCNDLSIIPLQISYTYSELSIDFTTTSNGTNHIPTVQTENLTPENNLLCSFDPPVVSTVEGFVWWDRNKDGIQQNNEGGLGNIGINLHNATDFSLITSTFTESDGTYTLEITNTTLDYYLVFGTAPLYSPTLPNSGSNASLNSDITNSIGMGSTDVFSIEADETLQIDGGLLGTGTASGLVWRDDNGDGIFAGETGAEGVSLLLTFNGSNFNNIPFTTTTQNGGLYSFDNLIVGEITIEVADIQGTIIEGGTLTTANNPSMPFQINMNQLNIEEVNFGFQVPICNIEVLSATTSECNPDDNTYSLTLTIAYENEPSGDIEVTVLGNTTSFTPDGSGQETFTIEQLNANGFQNIAVSAGFENNPDCNDNLALTYDAPASCNVDCSIEITDINVGACNPETNQYSIEVTVNYEGAPNGDINIEVLGNTSSFAADGTGTQTFSIDQLTANGFENIAVSASFANDANCNDNLGATYHAPSACDVQCSIEVTGVGVGDCNPSTNSYTLDVKIKYDDAPNGILNIELLGTTFPFLPDGSGEETFSIVLPTSETDNVSVTASFADNPNCSSTLENAYDEPADCVPQCDIKISDISVGDCNEDTNMYLLELTVSYINSPDGDILISLLGDDYPFPSNGSGTQTVSLELPAIGIQNVAITASFDNAPNCSITLNSAYNEPESCINDCPSGVTATASATEVCNGEVISLKAVIDNENFVLVWMDENGETFDHNNVLLTNETCAPIVRTFTSSVTCTTNSSMKFEDSIDITVFPTDISAFITPVAGGCTGTVLLDESCGDHLNVKPFEAEAGTSGIGFVILNWVGGGECIDKLTIPVPYDCAGGIQAVNDHLGTFTIGESVTFPVSQILANDIGNNISLVDICSTSDNGGTITNNSNGTYTYSPPSPTFIGTDTFCYTITDSNGNTDEAIVSVTYGDIKFVADITYTCDADEGTYTLILTIQGSSTYLVEVMFPETQTPMTMQQGVIGLGPFSINHPNYSVKITQVNTGGSITIDGVVIDCITLPIELVTFEGEVKENGNLLKWVTASEFNNDFYDLQRSLEGTYFETIYTTDGAGTTSSTTTYDYTDRLAPNGISYYRLQQTDFDGSSTTSKVIALRRGERDGGFDIISVTPLGDYQHTAIGFEVPKEGKVEVKIFDVSARLVHSSSMNVIEGFNTLQINTSHFSHGVYLLQLQHGDTMRTVKILK